MEEQIFNPSIRLIVTPEALPLFTTVLQSGIEVKTCQGETLAKFLSKFPGFTADYLTNIVQTIFLNGTAVDDLSLPLQGRHPVLALSAAMPGLAGAIFRKNSFHSALRTEKKPLQSRVEEPDVLFVTLKLFNSIARDRGPELLQAGFILTAEVLLSFLLKRPQLMQQILKVQRMDKEITAAELLRVLPEFSKIHLKIITSSDREKQTGDM